MKLNFLADDFTGASDVLLQCRKNGMHAAIISDLETDAIVGSFDGIASTVRSMTPGQMDDYLPETLRKFRQVGTDILLYKVCSTFDSSPTVGSIGYAIRLIRRQLGLSRPVVLVPAQPEFGRFTVFGNHFAASGETVYRLDRHPVMSTHPTTPMGEADLRLILAEQGIQPERILDLPITSLRSGKLTLTDMLTAGEQADVIIVDALEEADLDIVARDLISAQERSGDLVTVIGSGGIAGALARTQGDDQDLGYRSFPPGAALVLSGSRSPVTREQIDQAISAGWMEIQLHPAALINRQLDESYELERILTFLQHGRSVIVSIENGDATSTWREPAALAEESGRVFTTYIREAVKQVPSCRVAVLGGDTSSWTVSNLQPSRIQAVAPFVQAGPILNIDAPGMPPDTPFLLKGGQVGGPDTLIKFAAL